MYRTVKSENSTYVSEGDNVTYHIPLIKIRGFFQMLILLNSGCILTLCPTLTDNDFSFYYGTEYIGVTYNLLNIVYSKAQLCLFHRL